MDCVMDMVSILSMMLSTKESGLKVKNTDVEKSSLQVGVFLRDRSRMI